MADVYEARTRQLQRRMKEERFDAVLLFDLASYHYYTGDFRKQPRAYIPAEGDPVLLAFSGDVEDARRSSWVKDVRPYNAMHEMMVAVMSLMKSTGKERPVIGANYDFHLPAFLVERFRLANPSAQMRDASDILMEQRIVKSQEEIEKIATAQTIATRAMERAAETIAPGVPEFEVAAEIEYVARKKGAESLSFGSFVNSGARSQGIHGMATRKLIEQGDPVLVDISPVYNGYCGNLTRLFSVGPASPGLKEVSEAYLTAKEGALAAVQVGGRMMDVDSAFYEDLKKVGLGEYQVRGISHGIGLAFEEKPFPTIFPEHMIFEFRENMTVSVGHSLLYVPGKGGARFEDVYQVTRNGPRQVAPFDARLVEL